MGVFCFSQRSETKNDPLADRGERAERWWESGVVGVASDKLALSFGARPALIRTDGKGPLYGPSTGAPRSGAKPRVSASLLLLLGMALLGEFGNRAEKFSNRVVYKPSTLLLRALCIQISASVEVVYGAFVLTYATGAVCGCGTCRVLPCHVPKDPSCKVPQWTFAGALNWSRAAKNMAVSPFRTDSMAGT